MSGHAAPGRPREFDEKEILRIIMGLFWKGGFEGVSLGKIMKATGLQKASLYAAYGDKRSLYLKALAQYEDDVVRSAARSLKDSSVPAKARLEAFLGAPLSGLDQGDRSGCFLCNASADQADLDNPTRNQVSNGFEILTNAISAPLKDLNPGKVDDVVKNQARLILSVYTGMRIMVRGGVSQESLSQTLAQARHVLIEAEL